MHEVLKEMPPEVVEAIRDKLAELNAQQPPPRYAGRFKAEAKRISRHEDDADGLDMVLTNEGTNVIIDFGGPVQVLGLTLMDCQAVITMLMDAVKLAMMQDLLNKVDGGSKVN